MTRITFKLISDIAALLFEGIMSGIGLTVYWRPGWCPHVSAFRPEPGLVSLDCWPEKG